MFYIGGMSEAENFLMLEARSLRTMPVVVVY
jgi:hypothetical protein